ncbi:MAG: VPLPA-CTERM sorting domain-containing protein [Thermodesulfobacteriota bacterium]|nr:VPLPA-CTERM sorting domain-containing protein [Thermodesulfobacteriota bacterium]
MKIKSMFICLLCVVMLGVAVPWSYAAIYSGPTDTNHAVDPAIEATSSLIKGWATGYVNYIPAPGLTSNSDPSKATGPYGDGTVSLGDLNQAQIESWVTNPQSNPGPGEITLTFSAPITNGPGFDFAVFENGFVFPSDPYLFAEVAYVEVSTDGVQFARFPNDTQNDYGWEGDYGRNFGGYDSTGFYNLVGKHAASYGTPFDLDDLLSHDLVLSGNVDLGIINYVKMFDIPGIGAFDSDGNSLGSPHPVFTDSDGDPIYDNWLTTGTGGLDLDAVGVINAVPIPGAVWLLGSGLLGLVCFRRRKTTS